jgi:hypothetical protein
VPGSSTQSIWKEVCHLNTRRDGAALDTRLLVSAVMTSVDGLGQFLLEAAPDVPLLVCGRLAKNQ